MELSKTALKLLNALYQNYIKNDSTEFTDEEFSILSMSEEEFKSASHELNSARLVIDQSNSKEKYLLFLFNGVQYAKKLFE